MLNTVLHKVAYTALQNGIGTLATHENVLKKTLTLLSVLHMSLLVSVA